MAVLVRGLFAQCAPPPDLTVSTWADEERVLSREDSNEPGKWRTSRFEPQRGIMDAMNDPTIRSVKVKKGAQVGWTAMLCNVVGYHMHHDPCPMLFLMPTLSLAQTFSKKRLTPMLRDTPALRKSVQDPRSRDSGNTILEKDFPGGYLAMVGANSPSDLASRPIRIVLEDEVDKYPVSATNAGDPQELALTRQTNFWNAKTLTGSTPLHKGGPIDRDYEASDKRMCHVKCQHCGERQTLRWEQVKFDRDEDKRLIPETVFYQCEYCGTLWDDADRVAAVNDDPEWRATAPFRGTAGFFLPQLYSPFAPLWKMVDRFLKAGKDPAKLQVFVNEVLGEGWEEQGERPDDGTLMDRAEAYGPLDLPERVICATAGVDTQDDRLEVQVICWGDGDEAWAAKYVVLHGDPAEDEVWERLDELLRTTMRTESGRLVRIRATCIDSQGHHAERVYQFCRGKAKRGVFAIAGRDGPRPIWPTRVSRSSKSKSPLRIVGVDTAKDHIYGRLRIEVPDDGSPKPGAIHFPMHALDDDEDNGFGAEYYAQLTAEEIRTKFVRGKPKREWWKPKDRRNEALDTFVYALAARKALSPSLSRYAETTRAPAAVAGKAPSDTPDAEVIAAQAEQPKPPARSRGSKFVGRRGGGWMSRGR